MLPKDSERYHQERYQQAALKYMRMAQFQEIRRKPRRNRIEALTAMLGCLPETIYERDDGLIVVELAEPSP